MAPGLPSELFREIINCFSKAKDLRTLQAAALVSSAFRVPCQEEIFSEVKVYKQHLYENNTNHHLAGLEILRQNGTLLSYIKIVSVQQSKGGPIFWEDEAVPPCMPELIQLIATASIQKFTFVGWEGQTTPDFQRSIIACVRSPCLTSISLTFAPGALLSMVESPHVRHLKLTQGHTYLSRPPAAGKRLFLEAFPSAPPAQRMRLTSLTITPDRPTIDFLTEDSSAVELSTVKELKLDTHKVSRGNVSLLIERCAPSLRRMRIAADVIENNMLSSRSQLHHLEELVVDEESGEDVNPYANLPSFLEGLPSPSRLSYIELENFFEGGDYFPNSVAFWSQLDSILANRSRFPGLHMVKFRYTIVEPHNRTSQREWEATQQGYWPLLGKAGVRVEMAKMS